jgi:hypothetical protein
MPYLGTQPNDVKKNTGLYTPSEILQLTKDGSWGGSLELIEAGIEWVGGSDGMSMRVSNDNGSTYESTANYSYAVQLNGVAGNTSESKRNGHTSYDRLAQQLQNAPHNGYLYMYNAGNSSKYTFFTQQLNGSSVTSSYYDFRFGGGVYSVAETINAIKFFTGTYSMTGNMKLYGVKQI